MGQLAAIARHSDSIAVEIVAVADWGTTPAATRVRSVRPVIDVARRALIDGALVKLEYTEVHVALGALREAMNPD